MAESMQLICSKGRLAAALFAALLLMTSPAAAQEPKPDSSLGKAIVGVMALRVCAIIEADDKRLACFDAAAKQLMSAAPLTPEEPGSRWELHRETSKFDDTETVAAVVGASGGGRQRLWVYCQAGQLLIAVNAGTALKEKPRASIFYRFDKEQPEEDVVSVPGDESMFAWTRPEEVHRILDRIEAATSLAFRVVNYLEQDTEFAFDLTGAKDAAAPVRKACKL